MRLLAGTAGSSVTDAIAVAANTQPTAVDLFRTLATIAPTVVTRGFTARVALAIFSIPPPASSAVKVVSAKKLFLLMLAYF